MQGAAIPGLVSGSVVREPAKQTVEIRSLFLPSCKGDTEWLTHYLCASEKARAGRFRFRTDYERYVAARAALRLQLGGFLGCDPKSLSIRYTSHEKPFVEDSGIEFNLSHSGDWVLYAFTGSGEVGVDVEQIRSMPDMRDVAQQNFASQEFARWDAMPEEDRDEAFYQCWSRKESFVKAIGEGLSCPLDSFEVSLGASARLASTNGDEDLAAHWWITDLPGFTGYAAAATARCANPDNVSLVMSEVQTAELLQTSKGIV